MNTACFLDFDHTLFNTDEFFHLDLRNTFLRFGIDKNLWEKSYDNVWRAGYTIEKHLKEIQRQSGSQIQLENVTRILQESFSDLRRYVFPDVIRFLEDARKRDVRLFLLSFGDPDWQRHKVTRSRLDSYFDSLFFIPKEGGKAKLILEKTKKVEQIVLIDNDPEELDLLKDAIPTAKTYFITRVPDNMVAPKDEPSRLKFFEARRYLKRTSRYKHITCTTLDGIFSL